MSRNVFYLEFFSHHRYYWKMSQDKVSGMFFMPKLNNASQCIIQVMSDELCIH